MPQLELSFSATIHENQKDAVPAAAVAVSFKDGTYSEYDGVKRIELAAGEERKIDIAHLKAAQLIFVQVVSGSGLAIGLRNVDTEATELAVKRFFGAELGNLEQVRLVNRGSSTTVVRVLLAGVGSSS